MNRWIYRLMYTLGMANWDTGQTSPELQDLFEQEASPPGAALDLGCGTGTNAIFMARQGRQVIGLDYVPKAIRLAHRKAQRAGVADRTRFKVADVTHLDALDLPSVAIALDMGCFHGLDRAGRGRYAAQLAGLMPAGGVFLLYTLDPHNDAGVQFGVMPEDVKRTFAPWFAVTRIQRGTQGGNGSTWFRMERCEGSP